MSTDPALVEYLDGELGIPAGNIAGVYNPAHISLYAFVNGNPISYVDPDGRSTWVDEEGRVVRVDDDDDLGIYIGVGDGRLKLGETHFWDAFVSPDTGKPVGKVFFGQSIDSTIAHFIEQGMDLDSRVLGLLSAPNMPFDVKQAIEGHEGGSYHGFLFKGKYATLRELGNYLAGYNAASHGVSREEFQRVSGGLHVGGMWGALRSYVTGAEYGPAPRYGEIDYQYLRSAWGYDQAVADMVNGWSNAPVADPTPRRR